MQDIQRDARSIDGRRRHDRRGVRPTAKKLRKQKKLAFVLRVTATGAARNAGVATSAVTLRKA